MKGDIPSMPMATFVKPSLHGLPNVSEMMTAGAAPVRFLSARLNLAADRSGSAGSSATVSGSGMLEASTPACAQTSPWWVSAMSMPRSISILTTRRASERTTSTDRGSLPAPRAKPSASAEGFISSSRTSRPSSLETTFWVKTSMSPFTIFKRWRRQASRTRAMRSHPGKTSGMPRIPMILISRLINAPLHLFPLPMGVLLFTVPTVSSVLTVYLL
jgi:hypothetical protein